MSTFSIYELRKAVNENEYERLGFVLEDQENNNFYLYKNLKDFKDYIDLKTRQIVYKEGFLYCTPSLLKVSNFAESKKRGTNPSFTADVKIFNTITEENVKLVRYYSNVTFEDIIQAIIK